MGVQRVLQRNTIILERVKKEWNMIDATECQILIEGMPRRVAAVVKAKGEHTKYQDL
jgi:hypothetical protein